VGAGLLAAIIAALIGVFLGVGGAFGLVQSQGGGQLPEQVPGAIVVYGTN
jgi:hypothetical protein